jgi:hypothetical protein
MVVDEGRLIVAEAGNGRLSVFDSAGAFVATRPAPTGSQYLAAARGALFTTLGVDGFYAQRIDDGQARHGAIPPAVTRLARSDPRTYLPADPFLAAPPEGPLYVLDPSVLALAAYDGSGRLLELRLLPDPFRARLLERRREEMEDWGARAGGFLSVPATKQISIDDRWNSRPVIRAFVPQAFWSDDFVGSVGGADYATSKHGLSAGMHIEASW